MGKKMTEEEQMRVNCSFEYARKAMIRGAQDARKNLELAKSRTFILERNHDDNILGQAVHTFLMVSDSRESLMEYCKQNYCEDITFDENYKSNRVMTSMGEATFRINEIGVI